MWPFRRHSAFEVRAGIEGEAHPLEAVFGFHRLGTDLNAGRPDRKRAGGVAASQVRPRSGNRIQAGTPTVTPPM